MQKMFSAALLDMDGLLLNTEDIAFEAFTKVCQDNGATFTEEIHRRILGTRSDFWSEFVVKETRLDITPKVFREMYRDVYSELIPRLIRVMPGTLEFLDWADLNSLKLSVVTSSSQASLERNLKLVGIRERFSVVVTAESVVEGKPSPEPYLKASQFLNLDIANCVVLEDSISGTQSGFAAGAYVIAIPSRGADQTLYKHQDFICNSMIEARNHLNGLMNRS
ncbi:hypothetical protein CO174_00285 [Candidatus Uhrbacteria bacterium CG_4_9_14_3_um_filter_50_9]|uniref:Phosphatase n=1 Tax=Candidatus Uhrbacteria bacterium CG_4_9_14_3_um_filter_50_9 TaxID=1975035 RepID=A0A2M7XET9_9BACT|nr:MAG: hypothetical protein CO174_00285 [Candidatus Uhrbacteria bacterium CG_4_9_14_3_um_filter_50_9]